MPRVRTWTSRNYTLQKHRNCSTIYAFQLSICCDMRANTKKSHKNIGPDYQSRTGHITKEECIQKLNSTWLTRLCLARFDLIVEFCAVPREVLAWLSSDMCNSTQLHQGRLHTQVWRKAFCPVKGAGHQDLMAAFSQMWPSQEATGASHNKGSSHRGARCQSSDN